MKRLELFHSIDRNFRKTTRQPSLLPTCLFESLRENFPFEVSLKFVDTLLGKMNGQGGPAGIVEPAVGVRGLPSLARRLRALIIKRLRLKPKLSFEAIFLLFTYYSCQHRVLRTSHKKHTFKRYIVG